MTQEQSTGILDRVVNLFTSRKAGELEQIESLLQGVIAEVEPRRSFREELGERLSQQAEDSPVVVEKFRPRPNSTVSDLPSSGASWLVTGLVGGLILIVMAVRLLIYYRGRDRTPQL